MKSEKLLSISPLDGRYHKSVENLRAITSEFGLIKYRVIVEIKWFIHLSKNKKIKELPELTIKEKTYLTDLIDNFSGNRFYEVINGERPDIVSQRLYDNPNYYWTCLLYTSPSPRDKRQYRMPSSA